MLHVIGLGNPGDQYDHTRHNVGRASVVALTASVGSAWELSKPAKALTTRGVLGETPVTYWLPETFMNRSGETGRFLVDKLGATAAQCVVIYDDIALPFGTVRVAFGKGDGGHNGLKSLTHAFGTAEYIRIRIGIAPKSFWTGKTVRPTGAKLSPFVLGRFSSSEQKHLSEVYTKVEQALYVIAEQGVTAAMNACNAA